MKQGVSIHPLAPGELDTFAAMNLQLQRDEGSRVMALEDAIRRLSHWLENDYTCLVFQLNRQLAGYVLYRPTDPDSEGHAGGIYIRQFFILPEFRRRGLGKAAFTRLTEEILSPETYITLEALTANPAGRAFWQALGFREYCVRYEREPGK